jgi:HlyD family secretion protein
VIVRCRGELRARRSVPIAAPAKVPSLRIVWLAPPGSTVKEGDPVVRFDPSSARQQLQQNEAALKQAQATLDQAVAQGRITSEQDKRDLAGAHYTLERAGLEVSKAEIVSRLKAEESTVDLGLAKQSLNVQEATVALHEASDKAKLASLVRLRDKAQAEVNITKARLEQMEVKSPIAGLVTYLPNYSQGWINAKQFKVGDQVWPGAALGEIPDLNTLEMEGKIEEIERGRVAKGQDARVRIDSLPELSLPAQIESISPLTQLDFSDWNTRNFIGHAPIRQPDPRLRPGMNGGMDVVVSRVSNAIAIPAKALFTRDGKPVVYLTGEGQARPVEVTVLARNPDEVAVRGIPAKAMVALAEPDGKEGRK